MHKGVLTKAGAYRKESVEEAINSVMEAAHIEDSQISEVLEKLKQFASQVLANPESFGVDPGIGQDDVDEEEYNFRNALAEILARYLKDAVLELDVVQKNSWDESLDEAKTDPNTIEAYVSTELEDDIEVMVSFEDEAAEPDVNFHGGITIYSVTRKDNGEDIIDQLDERTIDRLKEQISEELNARNDDRGDYEYERFRDRYEESEEVLGGDKSEDFINDVKVDKGDAQFREELERVMKNANFRK
jgi:hypothetical protein